MNKKALTECDICTKYVVPGLTSAGWDSGQPRIKYIVDDVEVTVVAERVQYYSADGKLIRESLTDYTPRKVHAEYATLDDFLQKWSSADQKEAMLAELLLRVRRSSPGRPARSAGKVCRRRNRNDRISGRPQCPAAG